MTGAGCGWTRRRIWGRHAVFAAVIAFGLCTPAAVAQQQDASFVIVAGRVIAADTGVALRRAHVAVLSQGGSVEPTFTDDDGQFTVSVSAQAQVTLAVSKAGYATVTSHSRPEADATLIVRMPRGAVLSGRVVDVNGAPVVAAQVVARHEQSAANDPNQSSFFVATTDDLGDYRIGGLPAGRYVVGAAMSPSPLVFVPPATGIADVLGRSPARAAPPPPPPPPWPPPAAGVSSGIVGPVRDNLRQRLPRVDAETRTPVDLRPGDEARGVEIVLQPPMGSADIRTFALERLREIAFEQGQQPPVNTACFGSAAMRGRVSLTSGEPLGGVTVRVTNRFRMIATAITRLDGTYSLDCLQPGEYTLEAARYGYVLASRLPDVIPVRGNETVGGPAVLFHRPAAVTGLVLDEHGEPMQGVRVRALQVRYAGWRSSAVPSGTEARTDDRGEFRIFGLAPGSYVVAASVDASMAAEAAREMGYAPLYYPGTSSLEGALPLRAEAGVDLTGVNMVFRPTVVARVSGAAIDASGQPVDGSVTLSVSYRSSRVAPEPVVLPIGAGGAFTIPNVPPGDYVLHVVRTPRFGPAEYASEYVTVADRDPAPFLVQTSPGATVEGRIEIEGGQPGDLQAHQFALAAHSVDPDRAPFPDRGPGFAISSVGAFYASGLHGPRRVVLESAPPGWYLKAVRVNGSDVTDTGFEPPARGTLDGAEIVLSARGASIVGRTVDARGEPVAASVVVLPVQRTLWVPHSRHVKSGDAREDGTFVIAGLPPGDYWVAAMDARENGAGGGWQDPALLDALASRAERITVAESERVRVMVPVR